MGKNSSTRQSLQRQLDPSPQSTIIHLWFWIGLALILPATLGLAATTQSLAWQLQTKLLYKKGHCRVIAAEILPVEHHFELRVAHQVEIDDLAFGRSEALEQFTPSYNSRNEAEESLAKYRIGSMHTCWYDAKEPGRYSVLVDQSMDSGFQLTVFAISLVGGAIGIQLIRRSRLLST